MTTRSPFRTVVPCVTMARPESVLMRLNHHESSGLPVHKWADPDPRVQRAPSRPARMRIATRPRRINGVSVSRTEIVPSTHHTLDHAPCTRAPCSNSGIHLLNADGDSGLAQQTSQCSHVFMRRNDRKLMMTQFYKPYSAACFQAQFSPN